MIRLLPLLALAGCVIGTNKWQRPRDLAPSWLVDRPRLLAVVAEPPEARPGELVRFTALLADPTDEIDTILWLACADDGATGCIGDDQAVIGVEPFQPPVYQAPVDFLDDLAPEDRFEGRYVTIQVTGLPPIDPAQLEEGFDFDDIDFNQIEAGYKRMVVSEATTPNRNPGIARVTFEGVDIPDGTVVEVDPEQVYDFGVFLTEELIEEYEFLNSDSVIEHRVEEPYLTWFATDGRMIQSTTLFPYTVVDWESPAEPGTEGTLWVVVRDRRGGQTWKSLPFRVRP